MKERTDQQGGAAPACEPGTAKGDEPGLDSIAARLLREGGAGAGSFVASPACLYAALEALARGAEGETLSEIESALGGEDARRRACAALFSGDRGQAPDGYRLNIAASVWANRPKARLRPTFVRAIADANGHAAEVDFGSPEGKVRMSSWLSESTGGKFPDAPEISPETVFAIIGALHFKDTWVDRLDDEEVEMVFDAPASSTTVTMMGGIGENGRLLSDDGATAVSWPMESGASIVFAMPRAGASFDDFVAGSGAWDAISRCHGRVGTVCPDGGIELLVPKIELRSDGRSLTDALRAMGIRKAFAPGAELGGITEADSMIGEVVQSAALKLDPNGAEGAAYTILVACAGCLPEFVPEPVRVVFDRPFAFAVFSRSGAPLFVGSYVGD